VTLIPGDGIGPEISAAVQQIFAAAKVCFLFDGVWNKFTLNELIDFLSWHVPCCDAV